MRPAGFIAGDELAQALWPTGRSAPARNIRCRTCRTRNRVQVATAITAPDRHACGACGRALFLSRDEPFARLDSAAYQHGLDRQSLAALRSVPGFPRLIRWMLEQVGDRTAQLTFMSDAIRCGEDQFPELVELVETARLRLGFSVSPAVYLGESPHMNAMTTGVKEPVIVVRSALLDQMNDDELVAVLGHEVGHLQAEHPLYQSVAYSLLGGAARFSGLVRVLGLPIRRAILRWGRCAELTADRAALLASRNLEACIGVMLVFAGGNRPGTSSRTRMRLQPFIQQCRDLAALQGAHSLDRMLGNYLALDRTHPHVAWRVMQLIQWVEHGNYLDILAGNYLQTAVAIPAARGDR